MDKGNLFGGLHFSWENVQEICPFLKNKKRFLKNVKYFLQHRSIVAKKWIEELIRVCCKSNN